MNPPGGRRRLLSGWGRTAPTAAEILTPGDEVGLAATLATAPRRGVIARGLGRSYGDAAQNAGGHVASTLAVNDVVDLDAGTGRLRVSAGASIDAVLRRVVPQGWFVPVTPGTRQVTVGGAVASDIHGKNHHRDGSWCAHLEAITLATPALGVLEVGPDRDPDLYWATAGGMGLTGLVTDATVRLRPIPTSRLIVDTDRAPDLDGTLALMADDHRYRYSVAWIDLMATGRSMGRSVLTRGDFAPVEALDRRARADPLAFAPGSALPAPPWAPRRLLNRWSIAAFNEVWFRKAPARRRDELQSIGAFFHPLDGVAGWNRLYGSKGFVQWQVVLPFGEEATLTAVVEQLAAAGATSFLAVLKTFGPANPGPLSFPIEGWTLALDLPLGTARGLPDLLDRLDRMAVDAGGRVYLAKDSRLDPDRLPEMYPRLDEWRAVRERVDPDRTLQSDLGRRLGL